MTETTTKKRGRPKKADVLAKTKGNRVARGRPKGDAAIINEYKARMLASPKSAKVLEKIFDAALDDEHKHQAAAWKIITDRVIPTATFEKDVVKGAGKNAIQINISGIGGSDANVDVSADIAPSDDNNDIIEAEYEDAE